MTRHQPSPPRRSDPLPALDHTLVEDVMRRGIVSCGPETDLTTVARIMAGGHIHAVVVSGTETAPDGGQRSTWGLITALDLVAACLPRDAEGDAGTLASTEVVTVRTTAPLTRAAQLMVEHQLSHLLVVSGAEPVGVLSTLDIAGCMAGEPVAP